MLYTQFNAYLKNYIDVNKIQNESEQLGAMTTKYNEVVQTCSSQREKFQREMGDVNAKMAQYKIEFDYLQSTHDKLQLKTEEKDNSIRTLEREKFDAVKKFEAFKTNLANGERQASKAIESERFSVVFAQTFFHSFAKFRNRFR